MRAPLWGAIGSIKIYRKKVSVNEGYIVDAVLFVAYYGQTDACTNGRWAARCGKKRRVLHHIGPRFTRTIVLRLIMRDKQALLLVPLGLRASSYLVWATSDRAAVHHSLIGCCTHRTSFPLYPRRGSACRVHLLNPENSFSGICWIDAHVCMCLEGAHMIAPVPYALEYIMFMSIQPNSES